MKRIYLLFSCEGEQAAETVVTAPVVDPTVAADPEYQEADAFTNAPQSIELYNTLKSSPAMLGDAEMKKFFDDYENAVKVREAKIAGVKAAAPAAAAAAVTTTAPVVEPVKKSRLFGGAAQAATDFSTVTNETLIPTIKSTFGIDGDDKDVLTKFLAAALTQRNQASAAGNIKAELDDLKSVMTSLPAPLASAIKAYSENSDWQAALNITTKVDYSKPFNDLSNDKKIAAIELITGNKIKPEELSEDKNKGIVAAATRAFETERELIRTREANKAAVSEAERQNTLSQVDASINDFTKRYPDIDLEAVKEIREVLTNPKKGIGSLFLEQYQENGKTKVRPVADIARRVALVMFGDDLLENEVARMSSKKRNEAVVKLITNSAADPGNDNNNNSAEAKSQEEVDAKKYTDRFKKQYTY